jgi:hypothetical protein
MTIIARAQHCLLRHVPVDDVATVPSTGAINARYVPKPCLTPEPPDYLPIRSIMHIASGLNQPIRKRILQYSRDSVNENLPPIVSPLTNGVSRPMTNRRMLMAFLKMCGAPFVRGASTREMRSPQGSPLRGPPMVVTWYLAGQASLRSALRFPGTCNCTGPCGWHPKASGRSI